ncbi:MAG: MOSC N-terminal beta barrel domain-containing protein [Angustibacter sp.]
MTPEADRNGQVVGRVDGLRAFPVKSMTAPRLEHARVEASGLQHDRVWAVVDDEGTVVTAKQVGGLREVAAVVPEGEHAPELVLAGEDEPLTGSAADAAIARLVGRPARLQVADGASFADVAPVHVVSRQAVEQAAAEEGTTYGDPACSIEEPRANIELDLSAGELETAWVGRELHLGEVVLRVSQQPRHCLGVYADVVQPGTVEVGDEVRLV